VSANFLIKLFYLTKQEKYSVINGSIMVSPEELAKSEKVQKQLKLIRKKLK
jgi:hypothetical protein